jgi:hypothetical protein
MPSLSTLPKELLLDILSYLPLCSIHSLAETYNYHITPTCLPLLVPLSTRRRHIKAMTAQYGLFEFGPLFSFTHMVETAATFHLIPEDIHRMREIDPADMPYRMEHLDWVFSTTNQLTWLASMPKQYEEQSLQTVVKRSERTALEILLGVTLPPASSTFYTTQDLFDRIPRVVTSNLLMHFNVRKVPSAINSKGGYVIPIYEHPWDRSFWAMYISPAGAHCVLKTAIDVTSSIKTKNDAATMEEHEQAKREGLLMVSMQVGGVWFCDVGFAEWLTMMCHKMGIYEATCRIAEIHQPLEEHVRAIYVTGDKFDLEA